MTSYFKSDAHARGPRSGRAAARRLLFAALFVLALATPAAATTDVYMIRGTADFGIYHVNETTGVNTRLYAPSYLGGSSATLAQRPSDGMLFYVINAANGAVYTYNPATPAVAPTALPNTLGAGIGASFRMAFSTTGTLYYMPDSAANTATIYSITQTGANAGRAVAASTVTGIPGNVNTGGDMAFSPDGNWLYIITSGRLLYRIALSGGNLPANATATAVNVGGTNEVDFSLGTPPATLGLAYDAAGRLLTQTQSPSRLWSINLATLDATSVVTTLSGGTSATGDLASANVPDPNLSVTKSDGVTNTYQGATLTYTITLSNNGTYAVTGTFTDTVPATLTGVTWTCAATAGSTCAAASGSGNSISTSADLAAPAAGVPGTVTYTVTGTVNASSGTIANTATVAVPAWLTDSNTGNNSATDTDNVVAAANISITKTAATAFRVGATASYTLAVANAGPQSAAGNITVTDTLPSGLGYSSFSGTNWSCVSAPPVVTCTHPGPIASGNSLPNLTLTVSVAAAAAPSVSNTATVSSPTFDPATANNSSTAATNVLYVRLDKSYALGGPNPRPGTEITYTIAFSNLGGVSVQNFYLVDIIPFSVDVANSLIVRSTEFKVGSMTFSPGTSTLTLPAGGLKYFSDAINFPAPTPPWNPSAAYTPVGTYDPSVTYVGWQFSGTMPPNTSASVTFTVRIR